MSVTLTLQGSDRLVAALKSFERPSRKQELMDTLASYGVSSTQQRFVDEKSPDGEKWKSTRRGGQVLRDTGRLFGSLTQKATLTTAQWGTNVIYAAIHQFGGTIKPKKQGGRLVFRGLNGMVRVSQVKIPSRPFLGITTEDRREIDALVTDWAQESFV